MRVCGQMIERYVEERHNSVSVDVNKKGRESPDIKDPKRLGVGAGLPSPNVRG